MNICKINGKNYDVHVLSITEEFNITHGSEAGRTIAIGAPMTLAPLGTWYKYNVTFSRNGNNFKEFDELFYFLSLPQSVGVPVEIVHGQETLKFDAYISSGSRTLNKVNIKNGNNYWGQFSVSIIPIEAQVIPDE